MTRTEANKKPLSCWYCDNSKYSPGCNGCYQGPAIPSFPECTCVDVPHEIIDLWELKGQYIDSNIFTWLPYHCGHFQARDIKFKCNNPTCNSITIIPEWEVVKLLFTGPYLYIVCSTDCNGELERRLDAI